MPVTINASTSSGLVQSADNSGQIELQTNGTTVATVNTSNNVQFRSSISVGNVTPTTSGAGITFPATQSASSDANTLDDYEEGTWTPTDASGASLSFTGQNGYYTKIGNMVYCAFRVTYPSTANGNAGAIGGLPYALATLADAVWGGYQIYTTYTTAAIQFVPNNGGTSFAFFRNGSTNGPTNSELSTRNLRGVVIYQTA